MTVKTLQARENMFFVKYQFKRLFGLFCFGTKELVVSLSLKTIVDILKLDLNCPRLPSIPLIEQQEYQNFTKQGK